MSHRDKSVAIKQAINYQSQIKGGDLQLVCQNRERLLSLSKQLKSYSINQCIFGLYIKLKLKDVITIIRYHMIKAIMLRITAQLKSAQFRT